MTITDNGDGTLSAAIDGTKAIENSYKANPVVVNTAETDAEFAKKIVEGEGFKTKEFAFEIAAKGDAPAAEKTTAKLSFSEADTKPVDFGTITFDEVGTYTYTVKETTTAEEGDGWTLDNAEKTVTVTVTDNGDGTLSAAIDETKTITNTYFSDPKLTVIKETTSKAEAESGEYKVGETITYKITVKNDGNVTISDVKVDDELTGLHETIESLAPGASEEFETSYTVTGDDAKAGKVLNEATAEGNDPGDKPVPGEGTTEDPVKSKYKLTVHYTAEGEPAFPDYVKSDYKYGDTYTVTSPPLTGFTADWPVVTGTITEDTEKWVTYTRNSWTLTINYRYIGGGVAAPTYTAPLLFGDAYDVASPTRAGYRRSQARVTGIMPDGNVVVTVYYIPIGTPVPPPDDLIIIDDYGTALGLGNLSLNAGDCIE